MEVWGEWVAKQLEVARDENIICWTVETSTFLWFRPTSHTRVCWTIWHFVILWFAFLGFAASWCWGNILQNYHVILPWIPNNKQSLQTYFSCILPLNICIVFTAGIFRPVTRSHLVIFVMASIFDRVTDISWAKMSPSQNKSQKTPFLENKFTVNNFEFLFITLPPQIFWLAWLKRGELC